MKLDQNGIKFKSLQQFLSTYILVNMMSDNFTNSDTHQTTFTIKADNFSDFKKCFRAFANMTSMES